MKPYQLINTFHGTKANVRPNANGVISDASARRALRTLCGMSDCTCGGTRGGQYHLEIEGYQPKIWRVVDHFGGAR